jgi:prophage maintenance system killer protein
MFLMRMNLIEPTTRKKCVLLVLSKKYHLKEKGKVEGIIAAVYQSAFGEDCYPSLEEKAANLLYFMIKDHPYADGCKRIAASLFLEFLEKNNALFRDGQKIISDGALVAITLMIAESRPEEKDIMVALVMNFLTI